MVVVADVREILKRDNGRGVAEWSGGEGNIVA